MAWTTWWLAQPILDNKAALKSLYPGVTYGGDIGDASHQARVSDHNPRPSDGAVMAQDFDDDAPFSQHDFFHFLLDSVRAGKYPEVQYLISQHPSDRGTGYYGLFDRLYGFRQQSRSVIDHATHVHSSYRIGYEHARSSIIQDFYSYTHPPVKQKGRINMSSGIIPDRFAYDEQGNLIDETAVVTLVGEWSQVSASVPSLGAASGAVGCHWGEPLLDADRELLIKVEYAYRDSSGHDQFIPKIVTLKHFHQFDWTALPAGAFAFSAGFVKSVRNDLNLPVSVSLTYGSK